MKLEKASVAGDGSNQAKAGAGGHLTRDDRAPLSATCC